MLIVFGGLPGTGKSTIARAAAQARAAIYLRIDAIEQSLRESGMLAGGVGPAGYVVAYGLAASNLRLGGIVIADCVNPLAITRNAWRDVAARTAVPLLEVEIVCSDPDEHRRRVETRQVDVPGLVPPAWEQVMAHDYAPWDRPHPIIDTARCSVDAAVARLFSLIDAAAGRRRSGY